MTPADSPENKCPGDFLGDDLSGVHTCHAGCPCHSSGGEAGSREARNESRSSTTSGLIHTSPPVDPQCPDCPSCSPSVPDREGNEARNEAVRQFLEQVSDRDWYCATAEVEMALLTHDVKLPSDLCEEILCAAATAIYGPLITWLRASSPSPDRRGARCWPR
jgi:hypothetical protein